MQTGNIRTPQGISGTPKEVAMLTKPLRLGVDVAGMGRDNGVFAPRFGDYLDLHLLQLRRRSVAHGVAGKIKAKMQQHLNTFSGLYPQAMIDTIGEGAGTFSRLVEIGNEDQGSSFLQGRVNSAKYSEAAIWNEQPLKDISEQFEFLNMRAYLIWAVRDWLDPRHGSKAGIPLDDEFLQEVTEIKWKFNSKGKIQIEEKEKIKKRLKRSIDKFDALAETFWPVSDVEARPAKKKNVAQFFH